MAILLGIPFPIMGSFFRSGPRRYSPNGNLYCENAACFQCRCETNEMKVSSRHIPHEVEITFLACFQLRCVSLIQAFLRFSSGNKILLEERSADLAPEHDTTRNPVSSPTTRSQHRRNGSYECPFFHMRLLAFPLQGIVSEKQVFIAPSHYRNERTVPIFCSKKRKDIAPVRDREQGEVK